MPRSFVDELHEVRSERDLAMDETSNEPFDRTAFAMRALDLVQPRRITIAVRAGSRLRVETGRQWGKGPGARWAVLAIPPTASRRAITAAIAELAGTPRPYAWDVLFAST